MTGRSRIKLVALRLWVWLAGLVIAAYLIGATAVLLQLFAQGHAPNVAFDRWKGVVSRPRHVLELVVNQGEIRTYAFSVAGVLACLVGWSAMGGSNNSPSRPTVASGYGSHGTGRWAHTAEVLAGFPETGPGAVLGRLRLNQGWRTVIYPWSSRTKNRFVLVIGPPGSGKTSRYSLPNLLHAAHTDPGRSLLITDPKGELYREMAGLLRQRGYEIRMLNLIQPRASDRYNPLDYVHAVEDAFRLSNTIIINTSGHTVTGDAFWTNAERSLLACLIWYVKSTLGPEHQHLAAVLHLGNAFAKDPELMERIFSDPKLDATARGLYGQISSLSDKTRDGVFIGFAVRLQLWTGPEIAALTSVSDFGLRDLGRRRIALFLIIPDHHSTYQALTSLFFDQAFQELIAEADAHGGRLPFEIRMMLEEMANIGRIPDLEKRLSTIRSRGILVEMILQTIGQLRLLYGDAWNTITGCSDTILALAANDQETAEWLSKRLGTSTIRTTSVSSTANERGDSNSQSLHYTSRALLLPDEVQGQGEGGLGADELLLIQRSMPPARLIKYPVDEFPGQAERIRLEPRDHPVVRRSEATVLLPDLTKLAPEGKRFDWLAKSNGG